MSRPRLSPRRRMIGLATLVVSATGTAVLMPKGVFQSATTDPVTDTIQLTGSVQPVSETPLDFGTSGEVLSVDVKEGQVVDAGTVLANLDQAPLISQLTQAQGALGTAQAKLAQDEQGPVPAEVLAGGLGTAASSQDQVNSAQAALTDTEKTTAQDVAVARQAALAAEAAGQAAVAAAQQQVTAAQANLSDVVLADQEAVAGAQIAVAQAQQTADAAVATAKAQVVAAQKAISDAQQTGQANVAAAQAAAKAANATVTADQRVVTADQHTLDSDESTTGQTTLCSPNPAPCSASEQTVSADQRQLSVDQATLTSDQAAAVSDQAAVQQAQAQAQSSVDQAKTQLTTADVALTAAEAARTTNVLAAQNALAQEVARAKGESDQAQVVLTAAQSGLQSAQAALATSVGTAQTSLGQAVARAQASDDQAQATLNAAKVGLQNAQRTVTALGRGPIPQLIAGDQQSVNAAESQVTVAQHNLSASTIVAPVRGYVEHINTFVGATVSAAGTTSKTDHAIVLYTPGAFTVTGPVSDAQIGKVRLGDPVSVVPAGSVTSIPATVTQVSPAAVVRNGVPMYDVTATLRPTDLNLPPAGRAGMTITVRHTTGAVVVPNGAVHKIGQWNVVLVPGIDHPVGRPVTVGSSSSDGVEITSGLVAGEPIVDR